MASTRPHPKPARGLRLAFLLSYLAGAGVIGASVVVPIDLYLLIGLPNAAILIYILGFMVRRRPGYLAEPFADSVFHLGFLFTVTSLLASLLPYALEASTLTVEAILSRFGVALTTTLFGLIASVTFRQFAMTVDQAETLAHDTLSERTQDFSRELDTLVDNVRATVERLNSELANTVDASVEGIQSASKAGIAELRDTAAAARDTIGQSTGAMVDQLDDQMRQAFQRSTASIDAFGETMEGLGDKTATILEPFSAEMTGLVAELQNVREASVRNEERITRIFESYEMMIAKLREAQEAGHLFQETLGTRISATVTALEFASRTIETLAGDTNAVIGGLGREIDSVQKARIAIAADAADVAEIHARLSEELNAAMDHPDTLTHSGIEDPALKIDEKAFGEIGQPADDDKSYIPSLMGRHNQPR